ncbi:mitochondrial carrier [Microthyrium microscopicum]|uniref:Mitochondrial carrier n=1 Tax=Microthyrium microscopicum TaxID=703497 RepID=A0A6A6UMW2_9PEZI|nr:mitochondrial carrier [Microthyrium microscopicum]
MPSSPTTTTKNTAVAPQDAVRPQDHRRPRQRARPYPLSDYAPTQIAKILAQENRVKTASLVSSICSQVALYPMDSIKTRMQVHKFSSVYDCISEIKRTEGLRHGLYRGIVGPTVSYSIVRMITFDWYNKMKYNVDDLVTSATGESVLVAVNTPGSRPSLLSTACFASAGAVVGFGVSFLACPFELLKVGRQMSGMVGAGSKSSFDETLSKRYRDRGTLSAALDLYRRIGIRGLYSGIHLHAVRDTVGTGIFWGSYEGVKQLLSVTRGGRPDSPLAGGIAGGFCGMLAYLAAYPIDTVKAVYQRNCLFSKDGHKNYVPVQWFNPEQYRGLPITMTRVFMSNLIQMWIFEYMKKEIRAFDIDPPPPARLPKHDPLN